MFKDVKLYILWEVQFQDSNYGFLIFPTTNKISGDSIKKKNPTFFRSKLLSHSVAIWANEPWSDQAKLRSTSSSQNSSHRAS